MIVQGVWRKVKKKDVPSNRRLIGNKWVFKRKKDGRFRARLVALGYSQTAGLDYDESHAPVVQDVTWHLVLVLKILFDLDAQLVDVETAFLHGDLENEIYMKTPIGLNEIDPEIQDDDCVELLQSIYGLVQSARSFATKFLKVLREDMAFCTTKIDPCLVWRKNQNGIVIICIYVDDAFFVGDLKAIQMAKTELKQHFKLKVTPVVDDYIGCSMIHGDGYINIWQPDLIKKMIKKFSHRIVDLKNFDQ